jgi:LPXTG-site transpeptidase (sortase) family protein
LPGPFANLKNLKYGDPIIIHLFDQQYIFEVQSTGLVHPETTAYAFEHLEDNSYLTLVTCQNYDLATDSYSKRRVVRAVLVSVK